MVFQTVKGTPPDLKHANNWLKDRALKDFCTSAELSSLTPKSWRKGWSNWGQDHPDPEINRIAYKVMCHSQDVQQSNYSVVNTSNALKFGKAVIASLTNPAPSASTTPTHSTSTSTTPAPKRICTEKLP